VRRPRPSAIDFLPLADGRERERLFVMLFRHLEHQLRVAWQELEAREAYRRRGAADARWMAALSGPPQRPRPRRWPTLPAKA
jgi:hypothetical protein